MATYIPILHPRKKKDGTQLIMIKITKDRKRSYISTQYYVKEKEWNNGKVRASHPSHEVYNAGIKKIIRQCEEVETKALLSDHRLSSKSIKEKFKQPDGKETFHALVSNFINSLAGAKPRTKERYHTHLKRFTDEFPDIKASQITKEIIHKFESKLIESHSENTLQRGLKFLSGTFAKLQEDDIIPPGKNPFKETTLKVRKSDPERLTVQEIKKLYITNAPPAVHTAGRTFLLLYFLGGLRISEVLTLKVHQVTGPRLKFESMKTEKNQGRVIVPQAREIIDEFIKGRGPDQYLLPYLTLSSDHPKFLDEIESRTAQINERLKSLAKIAEINKPISTKIARHSFTQHYKKSGATPFVVRDTLGHSSVTMSENYEQYDNEEIDSAMSNLFGDYFKNS